MQTESSLRAHDSPPVVTILSQINSVHITSSNPSKIHHNTVKYWVAHATNKTDSSSDDWIY
jgi:hypothetical protein